MRGEEITAEWRITRSKVDHQYGVVLVHFIFFRFQIL